jgi:hypothetical protein
MFIAYCNKIVLYGICISTQTHLQGALFIESLIELYAVWFERKTSVSKQVNPTF